MPNEDNVENMTITETAPDGTQTVIEITTTKPDDPDDRSLIEEVFDAVFDDGADDSDADAGINEAPGGSEMYQTLPTDDEINMNSVEFSIGQDTFPSGYVETPVTDNSEDVSAAAEAEQTAHAEAARDAQAAADDLIDRGDYAAAAEARATAEDEAYAAGDDSMLGSSSSGELENAAYQQEAASEYRDQQAEHIATGDYEAAKQDAQNAAYATESADWNAGGADHSGQSDRDVSNLDWAVWDQKNAEGSRQDAEWYAEHDLPDAAAAAADQAGVYDARADDFADSADPTSAGYDYDPSSAVDSGGSYDVADVDTGFDAGTVDTSSASTYDPGTDDV
ncbi:MAG: hypothetical protein K1X36_01005 [Pyrinomonadaceae bacterium]|nr:hypothetical protein [Pyrinomonadaceae bacterium]